MTPMTPGWNPAWQGPMTVGRLLDRIWTILRGHAKLFLKLGVIPAAATLVLSGVMVGVLALAGIFHTSPPPDPQRALWLVLPAMLIFMVPMMVVFAVYHAATCDAALAINRGQEPSSADLNRRAWSKAGRYTWLIVLCWLIVAAPMLVAFGLFAFAGPRGGENGGAWLVLIPLTFLLSAGAMGYAIWMTLRLGLAVPACVAEDLTAWEAVERSGRLTVKAKGRMFLVFLVVWAISYAAMLVFEMVAGAAIGILMLIGAVLHMQIEQPASIAVLVVVGIVFMAAIGVLEMLMWSAYIICLSVIYEDQVLRIDGPASASPALAGGEPA
ncbi:MAG TPA: hypothetical protein VGJ21_06810 [Terracidiphilus sp.]